MHVWGFFNHFYVIADLAKLGRDPTFKPTTDVLNRAPPPRRTNHVDIKPLALIHTAIIQDPGLSQMDTRRRHSLKALYLPELITHSICHC